MGENTQSFPKNFLWGAATSAHQVEGGLNNNWARWEKENAQFLARRARYLAVPEDKGQRQAALDPKNYLSGAACDHYHLYKKDFDLMEGLGFTAYRFSIEWSRIEPEKGKFDEKEISHYLSFVRELKKRNIEPIVTIWHWTIPLWLEREGGIGAKKIVNYFERYSEKIVSSLKDEVKFWITLNEPEIFASQSYFQGIWPPKKKSFLLYLNITYKLIRAHKAMYKKIKKVDPISLVSISTNNVYFEVFRQSLIDRVLKFWADWWWNSLFVNRISKQMDFIGLNHYFHCRINYGYNKNKNERVSDLGWELHPESIYFTLMGLKKYRLPIIITENGLADEYDKDRGWFIKETLKNIFRAMSDGVDVRGYLHWSLLDNFEWDRGYWPRFGLIAVDYKTQKRKLRPSALIYKNIIAKHKVPT